MEGKVEFMTQISASVLGFETFFAREARECANASLRDAGKEEWKDPFKTEEHAMLLADLTKIHNRFEDRCVEDRPKLNDPNQ